MVVYGHDEPLQFWYGHPKADTAHSIVMPECKQDALFIFNSHITISDGVIDDKRQRGRMREHVCYGRSVRADETETQVGWRR
jgi:hypothetical protein